MRCVRWLVFAAAAALQPKYVVVFRDTYEAFRAEDFKCAQWTSSDAPTTPATCKVVEPLTCANDAAARDFARRSILVKYVLEEYGSGVSLIDAAASLLDASTDLPTSLQNMQSDVSKTWRVSTLHLGAAKGHSRLRGAQSAAELEVLAPITDLLAGNVDLKHPSETFVLMYAYASSDRSAVVGCWFGRLVSEGCTELLSAYKIAERPYIGSTTMDIELALIMARCARVEPGAVVLDPFAGTGGVLLATTHFSRVAGVGADIDGRILLAGTEHCGADGSVRRQPRDELFQEKMRRPFARGGDASMERSLWSNFDAVDLQRPRLVVSDVRTLAQSLDDEAAHYGQGLEGVGIEPGLSFDAIVTDPPYGLREKIGSGADGADWLESLFDLAVRRLKPAGRLVFWLPSSTETAANLDATTVAAPWPLRFVSCATQPLAKGWARTLLVYEMGGDHETGPPPNSKTQTVYHMEMADHWRRASISGQPPRPRAESPRQEEARGAATDD